MPEQGTIPYMDVTEGTLQVDGTVPHPPVRRKNVPLFSSRPASPPTRLDPSVVCAIALCQTTVYNGAYAIPNTGPYPARAV